MRIDDNTCIRTPSGDERLETSFSFFQDQSSPTTRARAKRNENNLHEARDFSSGQKELFVGRRGDRHDVSTTTPLRIRDVSDTTSVLQKRTPLDMIMTTMCPFTNTK